LFTDTITVEPDVDDVVVDDDDDDDDDDEDFTQNAPFSTYPSGHVLEEEDDEAVPEEEEDSLDAAPVAVEFVAIEDAAELDPVVVVVEDEEEEEEEDEVLVVVVVEVVRRSSDTHELPIRLLPLMQKT